MPPGNQPRGDLSVVSTINLGHAVQYRVVGESTSHENGVAVEPSLEDGYVWLMHAYQPQPAGARV